MLTVLLLSLAAIEPYNNPNNPNAPAYVKAEDAALQTTFAVEKFNKEVVESSSWSNLGIQPTDRVYIRPGVTVTIDTTDAVCEAIRVDGTLKFARNVDTKLLVTTIVGPLCASTLDAGTQSDPITAKCEVVFRAKQVDIVEDPREFGTGYVGHRTLVWGIEKQGQAEFVNAMAGAGAVSFTAAPKGWQIGDTIVLAGNKSDYINGKNVGEEEKVTITGVSGATVSFTPPLKRAHGPLLFGDKLFAINLTRNITFRSENAGYGNTPAAKHSAGAGDTFETVNPPVDPIVKQRGHFMVMGCGVGNSEIGYAAFNDLGRTDKRTHLDVVKFKDGKRLETLDGFPSGLNQVGRYSLHFHQGGRLGTPALVRGCASSSSPAWGFTNHSSNVHFLDCVAYDCIGAGFMTEIGDEVGLMQDCAAIGCTSSAWGGHDGSGNESHFQNRYFDREQGTNGSGFWLEGGRVRLRNLKVANCNAGVDVWVFQGTQVYAANRQQNIDGAIDPADVDPSGPDAYLLKSVDPATGTILVERASGDLDGLLSFGNGLGGDLHVFSGSQPGGLRPGQYRNVRVSAVKVRYTGFQHFTDCRFATGTGFSEYSGGVFTNGGDVHSLTFLRCQWPSTVRKIPINAGLSMGINRLTDCTLAPNFALSIDQNRWVSISTTHRPREAYIDNTPLKINWQGEPSLIMNRIMVNGKQLYDARSEPDAVPYPTTVPANLPPAFIGLTNRQLLEQYGQCVGGDVVPADAVLDPATGFKMGPISPRKVVMFRNGGRANGQDFSNQFPSGKIAKLPIEVYSLGKFPADIINVDHPVAPGWQTVFVTLDGLKYGVNVFGTGSTPPPDPPVPPPLVVTTVEVTPANLTLEVGKTAQLSAVVKDQFGNPITGKAVTWTSDRPTIASVAGGGVTGLAVGIATITSMCEGKTGTATITVTPPPPVVTTVEVTPANLTLEVGKSAQLTAVVKDQFGAVMPGKAVQWSSSNASVAAVSPSGVVTAIGAGNVTVVASCESKQGAANVTVSSPPPQPTPKTIKRVTIEYSDGTQEVRP